jgi:hypothetical protein
MTVHRMACELGAHRQTEKTSVHDSRNSSWRARAAAGRDRAEDAKRRGRLRAAPAPAHPAPEPGHKSGAGSSLVTRVALASGRHRLQTQNSATDMNTTTCLGDKPINRIGYGAMQLTGAGVFGPPPGSGAARAVLRRAIELGFDHIDTSQYYGPDVVNDLIRQALHPYPENLKLVTKVGARRDDAGRVFPAQRPDELREGSRRTSAHFDVSVWTS